ncbi:hypothetical protein TWF569_006940 [Orbilia oligospora]|uniref:Uncharacterized protein n=1 Tax=Orbilia oligospora TaxID=2813651 RepID=A0A7C8N7Q1_ORBOL|nr:hypothetical protein TWF102_007819 [Orbilia oligospora]KAF3116672.1 hypothetical protein TWF103_008432 [Orbilia oligospora]KAF3156360.1 hypothetical protein TWF569_006940 [Orbilia oligospora]
MRYPRFVKSGIWFLIILLPGVITAPLQPEESNSGSAAILNTFPIQKDELFTASIQHPSLISNKNSGEFEFLRKKGKAATASTISETTFSTDEFTGVDTQDKLDDTSLSLAIGEETICDKGLNAASSRHNSNFHEQLTLQPFIGYSDSCDNLQSVKVKPPLPESDKASTSLPPSAPPLESLVRTIRKRTTADETNPRAKEATVWQGPTDVKPTTKEEGNNKNTMATPTHGKADESRPTVYKSVQDDLEVKPSEKMLPVSPRSPGGEMKFRWNIVCETLERMLAKYNEGSMPKNHEDFPDPPIPQPANDLFKSKDRIYEPGAHANEAYWSSVNKAFSDFSNYRSGNKEHTYEQHGVMESSATESYLVPGTKEPFYLSGPEEYRKVAPWSSFTDLRSVQGLGSTLSKRSAGSESSDKSTEQDEAS